MPLLASKLHIVLRCWAFSKKLLQFSFFLIVSFFFFHLLVNVDPVLQHLGVMGQLLLFRFYGLLDLFTHDNFLDHVKLVNVVFIDVRSKCLWDSLKLIFFVFNYAQSPLLEFLVWAQMDLVKAPHKAVWCLSLGHLVHVTTERIFSVLVLEVDALRCNY